MKKIMHLNGAGTHTFYINGREWNGTDAAQFYYAYADATFVQDPGT